MFTRKTLGHIVAWAIFIVFESTMGFFIAPPQDWWEPFAFNVTEISFFYTHLFLLRKYSDGSIATIKWRFLLPADIGALLLFCVITYGMRLMFSHWEQQPHPPGYESLYTAAAAFRGIYMIILSSFLWLAESIIRNTRLLSIQQLKVKEQEIEVMKLEQDALLAANQLYRAQIKPHILFNTLNFIYSQVNVDPKAGRSVLLLNDIMRFALEEGDKDGLVTVEQEWQQAENCIELQKLRFEKDMFVNTAFVNRAPATKIPPLVILTILENTFVHGNLFDQHHPALLHMATEAKGWRLVSRNKKRSGKSKIPGHKLGIENTHSRLCAHYGNSAVSLTIQEDDLTYRLELIITHQ